MVRATGGLRRGWPPAAEGAEGDGVPVGAAPIGSAAGVIPIASAREAEPVSEPAELAGRGR